MCANDDGLRVERIYILNYVHVMYGYEWERSLLESN